MDKATAAESDIDFEEAVLAVAFDMITLDDTAGDELTCPELVETKDPPADVDKGALDKVTPLAVIEASARMW